MKARMKTRAPARKVAVQAVATGGAVIAVWAVFYYGLLPAETPEFVRDELFNVVHVLLLAVAGAIASFAAGYVVPPSPDDQIEEVE